MILVSHAGVCKTKEREVMGRSGQPDQLKKTLTEANTTDLNEYILKTFTLTPARPNSLVKPVGPINEWQNVK